MTAKIVLITGSSEGGIGDALAKEFHKKGLRVFTTAPNLTKVQHLKDLGLEVLPLDVTDDEQSSERFRGSRLSLVEPSTSLSLKVVGSM